MKTMRVMAVLAVLVAHWAVAAVDIDERRKVARDASVHIGNVSGDIEISTWDRDEVHLTGELGADSELEISATDGGLRIEVKPPNRRGHYEESELFLVVPEGASVSASGVSSDISVSGVKGASLRAETVSGDVEAKANVQLLELTSVSGDVEFRGSASRTSAETVSGDIDLEGLHGELEVSQVSGDVTVQGGVFSRGKFESVSGTIELELAVETGGRLTVENMSGDVRLMLPAGQSGEFRAQTFSGDIDSDFGSPQTNDRGPGSHLEYVAGDQGTTIRVESFSGDIEIGQK